MVTIAAAAAGFVIVFQFLALQLQAGNDPAIGTTAAPVAQGAHVAPAPATNGSSPVVTRTSAGATRAPVSAAQPSARPVATAGHAKAQHPVLTSASGAPGSGRGHSDDLD